MYENLFTALKAKGISYNACAAAIGMSEPTFRGKVNGRSQCGFSVAEALRLRHNVFPEYTVEWLFANNEDDVVTGERVQSGA